jgi:hypothetical protein
MGTYGVRQIPKPTASADGKSDKAWLRAIASIMLGAATTFAFAKDGVKLVFVYKRISRNYDETKITRRFEGGY